MTYLNGQSASDLSDAQWVKSGRSGAQGNCVEMARLSSGDVAMRNSRDPSGPALIFTREEIVAFIGGANDGDFDKLA